MESGIYFGLSKDAYHADVSLGSTNIRDILKSPNRFWMGSWMNPDRDKYKFQSSATVLGDALHVRVLEGEQKFASTFVRRPDDKPGASPGDKSTLTKAAKKDLLPHQTLLHGNDWQLCHDTGKLITEHKDLSQVLTGGEHEVSVFWTDEETGTPLKARFDILKPRGIGDIKTIANERGRRLDIAAKMAIKTFKYHVQAEHYMEGRRQFPKLVAAEKIFAVDLEGKTSSAKAGKIPRIGILVDHAITCAETTAFGFQFVFVSKEFPELWACNLSPANPILQDGRARIDEALAIYQKMGHRYGTQRWPQTWSLEELHAEDMPGGDVWGWE